MTFNSADDWLAHSGSVGRSITGALHSLADDRSDRELGVGKVG